MKKRTSLLSAVVLIVFTYVMFSYTTESKSYNKVNTELTGIVIPDDVMAIVDNKCYGCHNSESKSAKSKGKLNFDKFKNGYSKSKMISKLGKISKELHKNEMPPEKFLTKYPDKTLTADESALLISWAEGQKKTLTGE